ncbi:MAG: hypothetical protein ACLTR6_10995 [Clostridium fessum]
MAAVDATYASSIVFLIIPVLVVALMLRSSGLFTSVSQRDGGFCVYLFTFGCDTVKLDAKDGLIANAFDGMLSSIIFILFIFVMVSLTSEEAVCWMRFYALDA